MNTFHVCRSNAVDDPYTDYIIIYSQHVSMLVVLPCFIFIGLRVFMYMCSHYNFCVCRSEVVTVQTRERKRERER